MRITGGELSGRRLRVPAGSDVRPTQDRVREALFSMLAERVPGSRFLDLCAGSGAVGIEAWSRGAGLVWWVERSRRVLPVLRHNVATLCGAGGRVTAADALVFVRRFDAAAVAPFDIVYCDPPYRQTAGRDGPRGGPSWSERIMQALTDRCALRDDGLLIVETEPHAADRMCAGWRLADRRQYGGSCLLFYRPACETRETERSD